jgi:hypothetical protein
LLLFLCVFVIVVVVVVVVIVIVVFVVVVVVGGGGNGSGRRCVLRRWLWCCGTAGDAIASHTNNERDHSRATLARDTGGGATQPAQPAEQQTNRKQTEARSPEYET